MPPMYKMLRLIFQMSLEWYPSSRAFFIFRHWALLVSGLLLARTVGAEPVFNDVFVPANDGFKSIRIPSLVVTRNGALLAFAEGRTANRDQASNKILLKRSTDGGKTWGKV